MNGQQLKNSILQMAIQGKLVHQDPNDEPASVLLEKIRKEKEQLIKEGKIKKEKNPSRIYRASDNAPYTFLEERGKEVIDITDELPFEIPDSWEWAKINDVFKIDMGQSPSGSNVTNDSNGTEFHQGKILFGNKYLNKSDQFTSEITKLAEPYSILLCVRAPVGKVNITDRTVCIGRGLCSLKPIGIILDFAYIVLESLESSFVKQSTGTTFKAISADIIKNQPIPLPPLAEQQRIVDKLKELLPFIDEYSVKQEKSDNLQKSFPEQLKKSILQEAIQGKLVPQDPNDEPASVLLERIKKEKEELIKQGKIKKDKNDSIIFRRDNSYYEKQGKTEKDITDEIPFEIPDSWAWVRVKNICLDLFSGKSPKYSKTKNEYRIIGQAANQQDGLDISQVKYATESFWNSMTDRYFIKPYDVLLNTLGHGTLGRSGVVENVEYPILTDGHLFVFRFINSTFSLFFYFYLQLNRTNIEKSANGSTNQTFLSLTNVGNWLVPIPPLKEQMRIIDKIKKIDAWRATL